MSDSVLAKQVWEDKPACEQSQESYLRRDVMNFMDMDVISFLLVGFCSSKDRVRARCFRFISLLLLPFLLCDNSSLCFSLSHLIRRFFVPFFQKSVKICIWVCTDETESFVSWRSNNHYPITNERLVNWQSNSHYLNTNQRLVNWQSQSLSKYQSTAV